MEISSSVAKRKKRKTKKCLDEIRKRSRRSNTNDPLLWEQSSVVNHGNKATTFNGTKTNICITSNRLTLSMLPKVIRSETITRPILSEISEDPVMNFEKIIKNAKSTNNPTNVYKLNESSHSDSDYIKYSEDNSISSTCERFSAAGQMSIHKDSNSGNLSTQDNNSARSLLLFSPAGQREDSELFEVSPETLSTTSTSRSTHASYGYQLYEEFMSEIPVYLKQNTPALVKDDVMRKTKSLLLKIHLESCRQESEESPSNSMRKSLGNNCLESVVESPVMKYQHILRPHAELKRRSMYESSSQTMYEEVNCHSTYDKLDSHTFHDKSEYHSLYDKGDHLTLYDKSGSHSRYVKSDYHTLYDKLDCHSMYDKSARHSMCEKGDHDHLTLYDKSDRHSMYEIGHQTMLNNKYETPNYTYYPHKLNQ